MEPGAKVETPGESAAVAPRLFRNRDFVVPYLAETQSIAGDQVGRVALSILVFDRTRSVAWTALTYALTYLPAILGGVVLGSIGDRYSRVRVMVGSDVLRAVLFLGVAIPGTPLPVVVALVAVAFFVGPAFSAAMVSRLAAALVPTQFRAASGVRMISSQSAQVAGFAIGGVVVAAVEPRAALVLNAATFAVSALIVGTALGGSGEPGAADRGSAHEPAQHPWVSGGPAPSGSGSVDAHPRAPRLWRDPTLRPLILMTALAGFFVVPEGLAVPVADHLGASSSVAGLLLAAGPLGSAIGAALLVKFVPPRRGLAVARAMSIACGLPLIATATLSAWPLVLICWALTGALWAFQIDVSTTLVHAVADGARSRTIAAASSVLLGVQGVGLIAFGAVGNWLGADRAVSLAGLLGVCFAIMISAATTWSARDPGARTPGAHRATK